VQVIRGAFAQKKDVLTKAGFADLVTETDQQVEAMIIGFLRQQFPSHRCSDLIQRFCIFF
jgi:fructose-1,6-bisphosphatase/inositol monophosphatase family enzyme